MRGPDRTGTFRSFTGFLPAAPNLALGAACLVTWVFPFALGTQAVRNLAVLALFEFPALVFTLLAGKIVFATDRRRELDKYTVAGVVVAAVLAAMVAGSVGRPWALLYVVGLAAIKFAGVVRSPSREDAATEVHTHTGLQLVAYFLAALVAYIPPVPALGATAGVVALQGFDATGVAGVALVAPHRNLFFGVLYYGGLGAFETSLALRKRRGPVHGPRRRP